MRNSQEVIASNLKGMLAKTEATTVISDGNSATGHMNMRVPICTGQIRASLISRDIANSYEEMESMLTDAEKSSRIAERYGKLLDSMRRRERILLRE